MYEIYYKLAGCPGTCWAWVTLTFDLGPTWKNVSIGTSTHAGEQLCKFILKSNWNCSSYGLDKNLIIKCDVDLRHTYTNVSYGTFTYVGKQLHQMILKSIHNCRSYGLDKLGRTPHPRMHWQMHIHQPVNVTTMSRSPQADSTKMVENLFLTKSMILDIGFISIYRPFYRTFFLLCSMIYSKF